jgi:hypothetical protein
MGPRIAFIIALPPSVNARSHIHVVESMMMAANKYFTIVGMVIVWSRIVVIIRIGFYINWCWIDHRRPYPDMYADSSLRWGRHERET